MQKIVLGQKRSSPDTNRENVIPVSICLEQDGPLVYLLPEDWKQELRQEFAKPYFLQLQDRLFSGKEFFPSKENIFRALHLCPLNCVKAIIVGQDPYMYKNQADGLSYSVPNGVKTPPLLESVLKECNRNYNDDFMCGNDLSSWALQGVLMLNSILTVYEKTPMSHEHWGWENFTDKIIEIIMKKHSVLVFMLWGKYANLKLQGHAITKKNTHYYLRAPHPLFKSTQNKEQEFSNCGHFVRCNELLHNNSLSPINWGKKKDGCPLDHVFFKPTSMLEFAIVKKNVTP